MTRRAQLVRSVGISSATSCFGGRNGKLEISLQIQCEVDLEPDLTPSSVRVAGLRLGMVESNGYDGLSNDILNEQIREYIPWAIKLFHICLPVFPHLRVAELHANLHLIQLAVRICPELSNLPSLGGRLRYVWGCPRRSVAKLLDDHHQYQCIGVDPTTLALSGALSNNCNIQERIGVTAR